ncbi:MULTISPECIES: alkaline phosphatase family protein [Microbacterium]|uniref:alkaline phosphatase family protein n=1 Tax=Microbacterium TaxID=33882 RepID=UPI00214AEEAD|nr:MULTISPECIES: alkaline phosphatase family protein [unclassified Microbacterium]MCR2811758.1 alkaline phosphatase family protein [Microbacterium sp. zg.Y1084]MDL5486894.1 alkaline phosphatase family protein [Microbacterium sp. zg-Y1211]
MRIRSRSLSMLAIAGVTVAGLSGGQASAAPPPPAEHVVLIALDGFDAAYLEDAQMPNLTHLAKRGSLTTSTGVMTSITNPSWASIATGAWPASHLNTAYWFDADTGTARSQQRDLAVPTIAQAIREQGGTVMSAQWFILQSYGVTYGDPDGLYTQPGGACSERTDDAVAVLRGEAVDSGGQMTRARGIPDLIAVYCDTLDVLGHADGSAAAGLPAALADVDEQIGRLVQAVKDAGIYGRTAFVITGDHGMSTFTQGMQQELLAAISALGYDVEMLAAGRSPQPQTDVVVVVGGVGSLHLIGEAAADPVAASRIDRAVSALPHIAAVYDKSEQRELKMSPKYGELVIEPVEGWSLGATPADASGLHGTSRNLEVPLVLAGAGVRPNGVPVDPRHIDVAPTIAALLGYAPPAGAEGRVLSEAIRAR